MGSGVTRGCDSFAGAFRNCPNTRAKFLPPARAPQPESADGPGCRRPVSPAAAPITPQGFLGTRPSGFHPRSILQTLGRWSWGDRGPAAMGPAADRTVCKGSCPAPSAPDPRQPVLDAVVCREAPGCPRGAGVPCTWPYVLPQRRCGPPARTTSHVLGLLHLCHLVAKACSVHPRRLASLSLPGCRFIQRAGHRRWLRPPPASTEAGAAEGSQQAQSLSGGLTWCPLKRAVQAGLRGPSRPIKHVRSTGTARRSSLPVPAPCRPPGGASRAEHPALPRQPLVPISRVSSTPSPVRFLDRRSSRARPAAGAGAESINDVSNTSGSSPCLVAWHRGKGRVHSLPWPRGRRKWVPGYVPKDRVSAGQARWRGPPHRCQALVLGPIGGRSSPAPFSSG